MRRWTYALVIGAAALGGCTRADEGTSASTSTLIQVDSARAGSPQRTVLESLRYVQLSTPIVALDLYHPRVRRVLRDELIVESLASQRGTLQGARIGKLITERTRKGTLVSFEMIRKGEGPTRHSFVLRKRAGGWVVVYDTVLEAGLSYVAQLKAQERSQERTGKRPSPSVGVGAGGRAAQRYRSVFLRSPADGGQRPRLSSEADAEGEPPAGERPRAAPAPTRPQSPSPQPSPTPSPGR